MADNVRLQVPPALCQLGTASAAAPRLPVGVLFEVTCCDLQGLVVVAGLVVRFDLLGSELGCPSPSISTSELSCPFNPCGLSR